MIHLAYHGGDTAVLTTDPAISQPLSRLLRDRADRYPCLMFPREDETTDWLFHLQYFGAFFDLLRSEEVGTWNASSPDPSRTMTDELREELVHWEARKVAIVEARDQINPPDTWSPLGSLEVPLKRPLRLYQRAAVAWMVFSENGWLGHDVGLGKSPMSLSYCLAMHAMGLAERILILAPKSVMRQWDTDGIQKFVPAGLDDVQIVDGGGKARRLAQWQQPAMWTITNYEKVRQDIDMITEAGLSWDILLLDEAQVCRNRHTQLLKAVRQLKRKNTFALTATGVEMRPEDLFGIYELIHPGVLGNYHAFRRTYLLERHFGAVTEGYYIGKIRAELPAKISWTKLRRTKEEVLPQLPPCQETTVEVTMEGEQQRLYHEMEEECGEAWNLLEARQGKIDTMPIITKILRLQQIANHPEQFDPSCRYPAAKLEALQEILEMWPGKVILFSAWKTMVYLLVREINRWIAAGKSSFDEVLWISGDTTRAEERERIKTRFNQAPERLILVTTDCMKFGVNLQAAQVVVNYDLVYNPATLLQRIGRAHRLGMEEVERLGVDEKVFVANLLVMNSLEARIPLVLAMRRELRQAIVEGSGDLGFLKQLSETELAFIVSGKGMEVPIPRKDEKEPSNKH